MSRPPSHATLTFSSSSQFITYKYPTIDNIQNLRCPILILHGTDDFTIPIQHSKRIMKSYEVSHRQSPPECDNAFPYNSTGTLSCPLEDQFRPSSCSLRVKAVENGDLYTGMECIRANSTSDSLPVISLVEFPHGDHENLFKMSEWFTVVPNFIRKCVSSEGV